MTIKIKILALSIITVLVSAVVLTAVNVMRINELAEQDVANTRERLMESKQAELKQYVELARSSLADLLPRADDPEVQQQISKRLSALRFGDNGYIFAYTEDGTMMAYTKPGSLGKNLWDLKTKKGVYVIRELVAAAKKGGGYLEYDWSKPNVEGSFQKLSYAGWLPETKWMFGTGFYIDDIDATIGSLKSAHDEKITSIISSTLLLSAVIAIVLIGLSLALTNTIVRPLRNVTLRLDDIASNGGDLTQRLDITSNDELGALAKAFDRFVDKVHVLVKKTADTTELVNKSAEKSHQLSSVIAASVKNQRQSTDKVASAMQDMSAAEKGVSENAASASDAAKEADLSCSSAKSVVTKGVGSVQSLVNEIERASNVINDLKGNVGEIVSVLDVIRGIAEQTNLLALNAAIEAARAGEQGRGFAVVADEVRTLASRTQDSTQEIQSMIERLQQGSDEAVSVMLSSKSVGEDTVEHSSSAGNCLDEIITAVGIINGMNAQIADSAKEQSQVSENINDNIGKILSESKTTSEATTASLDNAAALSNQAKDLNALINQFKV